MEEKPYGKESFEGWGGAPWWDLLIRLFRGIHGATLVVITVISFLNLTGAMSSSGSNFIWIPTQIILTSVWVGLAIVLWLVVLWISTKSGDKRYVYRNDDFVVSADTQIVWGYFISVYLALWAFAAITIVWVVNYGMSLNSTLSYTPFEIETIFFIAINLWIGILSIIDFVNVVAAARWSNPRLTDGPGNFKKGGYPGGQHFARQMQQQPKLISRSFNNNGYYN